MGKEIRKIKIKSFETSKDLASCLKFSEGYSQVLTEQNINSTYINSYEWITTNGIFGVLAEYEGKTVGGLLLFRPNEKKTAYPFEDIIGNSVSNSPFILDTPDKNYSELFAIWHANSAAGWGLSYVLLKAGFALSTKLGHDTTLYLIADYNIRLAEKLGLEPVRVNGYEMYYNFETKPFEVRVYLYYFSSEDLTYSKKEKEDVLELSKAGIITRKEKVLSSIMEIEYHIG